MFLTGKYDIGCSLHSAETHRVTVERTDFQQLASYHCRLFVYLFKFIYPSRNALLERELLGVTNLGHGDPEHFAFPNSEEGKRSNAWNVFISRQPRSTSPARNAAASLNSNTVKINPI